MSVWSREPDTIVLPSGEKATDITQWLCALCFSALSSRDAATRRGGSVLGVRVQGYQCPRTRIPDFDGLVVGARDDGLAVGRKGHGGHWAAVRALLWGTRRRTNAPLAPGQTSEQQAWRLNACLNAFILRLEIQSHCAGGDSCQFLLRRRRFICCGFGTPASQILIVPSSSPATIHPRSLSFSQIATLRTSLEHANSSSSSSVSLL